MFTTKMPDRLLSSLSKAPVSVKVATAGGFDAIDIPILEEEAITEAKGNEGISSAR